MESHRDHQVIRIEDEPKSGIESSIREIQETINKSAFIIIQRRLNDMRSEEMKSQANRSYSFRDSVCIYRVPQSIKEMNCNPAEPELVSIGPYHRGKPAVLEFENSTKWKLVDSLLCRTRETGVVLQRLVDAMKELEMKARDCYSEPIEMSHDDFVQMMVIDGCFVVELLQQLCVDVDRKVYFEDDNGNYHPTYSSPILMKPGLIPVLTRDLLKLENQLPFFVLERIFDICNNKIDKSDPLRLMALKLFSHSLPRSDPESLKRAVDPNCKVEHLLQLFHSSYIIPILNSYGRRYDQKRFMRPMTRQFEASDQTQQVPRLPSSKIIIILQAIIVVILKILEWLFEKFSDLLEFFQNFFYMIAEKLMSLLDLFRRANATPRTYTHHYHPLSDQSMQCVTRLRPTGIKFRPRRRTDSLLEIKFHKGVLQIPPITINDVTIAALISCVAWEQCRTTTSRYFSAYVAFMNCLINSDRDVTFLCDDGIITSYSHDDQQIAQAFKELGEKVAYNIRDCYLSKQFAEVEAYYGSNWATLRRTYFRSPWSFISVATAALLLGFTAIQTIMAILSYVEHS